MSNCKGDGRGQSLPICQPRDVPGHELATSDGHPSSAHQAERYERSPQGVALRRQGMKMQEIAKRVGLGERTVRGWLSAGASVETHDHHRPQRRFEAYEASVKRRWDEGCHNVELMRDIRPSLLKF